MGSYLSLAFTVFSFSESSLEDCIGWSSANLRELSRALVRQGQASNINGCLALIQSRNRVIISSEVLNMPLCHMNADSATLRRPLYRTTGTGSVEMLYQIKPFLVHVISENQCLEGLW